MKQTARGDWLMGEDRGGTNVVEGQTGLPVSGTVKKKKKVLHGNRGECQMCVCAYVFSPLDEDKEKVLV